MKTLRIRILAGLLMYAVTCVAGITGHAQTSSGIISGRVVDQNGGAVLSAQAHLVEQQTGVSKTTTILPDGSFVFADVQPGIYSMTVQAPGFDKLTKAKLVLSANERLSAGTFTLHVGAVNQSVTVTAAVTPVQTTSAEISGELDTQQLDNLLDVGRDFMTMLKTIPGVVNPGGASSLGGTTTPYVNGLRNVYNSANVDGVSGTPRPGQSMDTPPNLDAIQEVKVLTSGYQAEYGAGAGGAVINVVTKSGTQQFHVPLTITAAMRRSTRTTGSTNTRAKSEPSTGTTRWVEISAGRSGSRATSIARRTSCSSFIRRNTGRLSVLKV